LHRGNAGTDAWIPPTGTTAQRPGSPTQGMLRFNTNTVGFEGYNGTQWTGIGGGNPWETVDNTDSPVSASANDRYFVDTSSAAVTINLPSSPLVGDFIRVVDLSGTFDTNNLTIGRSTKNIMGLAQDLTVSTENAAIGLVYSGATQGWKLIENA